MPSSRDDLPDWERLLAAERHLQHLVPGAVLVGGTAADLRDRFDAVLADLESAAGWQTERVQWPVLILGQLDGILTGIRQLRRARPDFVCPRSARWPASRSAREGPQSCEVHRRQRPS
jgi:hypothetical protein